MTEHEKSIHFALFDFYIHKRAFFELGNRMSFVFAFHGDVTFPRRTSKNHSPLRSAWNRGFIGFDRCFDPIDQVFRKIPISKGRLVYPIHRRLRFVDPHAQALGAAV